MNNIEIIRQSIRKQLVEIDELEGIIGHLTLEPMKNKSEIRRYKAELKDAIAALHCSERWLEEALAERDFAVTYQLRFA